MKFNPISSSVMALANELSRMFNKGIGADNLANNSVDSVHLKDGIITPVKLIPGLIPVSKRQMIWQGYKSYTTDNSLFLFPITGQLKITLLAFITPFIATISGGFDKNNGQIDYVFGIDSDVVGAWTLPPNKSFLQLYIEYNSLTKSVSYGYTELETVYLQPSSPSAGQHWFDKGNLMIMQEWDGSAWQKRLRLMVGEATTDASSVTSVIAYAVQCKYDSNWFPVATNTNYTKNHNIGIRIPDGLDVKFFFSVDSAGADASFAHDLYLESSTGIGHYCRENIVYVTRNTIKLGFGSYIQNYKNIKQTSGYYRFFIKRGW
jgi:hypothetical protein